MNFIVSKTVKKAAISAEVTDDPNTLSGFLKPECAAMVWRRQTPPNVQSWLDGLDPDTLPQGRVTISTNAVATTVHHIFDMAGLPTGYERDWLTQDVVRQANLFSDLLKVRYLRLRLDVVNTNSCSKFHIDAVTARLVCTYRGTGTQYGISVDNNDPKHVFTVQTGSSILLRGTLWPAKPFSGLRHRSPPIEGSGETRLILVLDPAIELEDEI